MIEELNELLEQSSNTMLYLINSQIALENGEIADSQKNNILAKNLISVMIKDSMQEVEENLSTINEDIYEYDIANTYELMRYLTLMQISISMCICNEIEDVKEQNTINIVNNKLIKNINTVKKLYYEIYCN